MEEKKASIECSTLNIKKNNSLSDLKDTLAKLEGKLQEFEQTMPQQENVNEVSEQLTDTLCDIQNLSGILTATPKA